jgi:hypothetical protein
LIISKYFRNLEENKKRTKPWKLPQKNLKNT